jgi:hypothetical protein
MDTVLAFLPDATQLDGLGAVLVAGIVLSVLGAVVGGCRWREADLAAGWGLGAGLLTVLGALTSLSLGTLAAGLVLAAGVGLWRLHRGGETILASGTVRVLMLAAPLLVLVAAMVPSQWDEFSQWLWNSAYLVENDTLPGPGRPPHPGSFPGYPFGAAVLPFLAARFGPGLIEQAGALGNILLLAGFGLVLARLIAVGQDWRRPGWGLVAAGLLLATLAGPSFVAKVALTAYADCGTAVLLAFSALLGWAVLEALAEGRRTDAVALAWKASLVLTGLVSFKQSNLVLLILLGGALTVVALRDSRIPRLPGAACLTLTFAVPLAVAMVWRLHVAQHLAGQEFIIRPPALWAIDALPDILASMATVALNKGGHFGSMLVLAVLGTRALWRGQGGTGRLLAVAAPVALGYQAFLLFAYVTTFDRIEAVAAASYWRYNQHVGALVTLALVAWAAGWRRVTLPVWLGRGLAVLVCALPILLAPLLRFDREAPKRHLRTVGIEAAALLGPADRVAVVEVGDAGFSWLALRWSLRPSAATVDGLFNLAGAGPETIASRLGAASHVLVRRPTAAVLAALGLEVPDRVTLLLRRGPEGWIILRRWDEETP